MQNEGQLSRYVGFILRRAYRSGESSLETAYRTRRRTGASRVKGSDLEFIESFKSSKVRPVVDFINNSFNDMYIMPYIFLQKESGTNCATAGEALNLFGDLSPTWGEINYKAFDMTTPSFTTSFMVLFRNRRSKRMRSVICQRNSISIFLQKILTLQ